MSSTAEQLDDFRKLLFISYASENVIFAKWLARKLAFYGYGVWIDEIKILGGECWVEEVDVAIKERSFRVLGLLSKASMDKPNPRKERTLALSLSKDRGIKDFLITLKLDGTKPDWTLSDISWIPFLESWAEGLRKLLKKLASIDAPRIHKDNPAIASEALDRGQKLVSDQAEDLITNWMHFINLPETLRVYDSRGLNKDDLKAWPNFSFCQGEVASLSPPPSNLVDLVRKTTEAFHWPSFQKIRNVTTHNIIVQILNKTVWNWLQNAGCVFNEEAKLYYIPNPFREKSIHRFLDADGSRRFIHTSGKVTIKKPSAPPETVIHHPGIRYKARKTDAGHYVLEIIPAVALFDKEHRTITGRRVGPRRKKVTRSWYNPHWRKRLLAFSQLLLNESEKDNITNFGLSALLRLSTNRSLIEANLAAKDDRASDDKKEQEIEIHLDEMDVWRE